MSITQILLAIVLILGLSSFAHAQYYDEETGFHQNGYRDYDPSTGRYLEPDPIGLDGGMNLYGYVDGNPVMGTDPRGLMSTADVMRLGGLGIGIGLELVPGGQVLGALIIGGIILSVPGDTSSSSSTASNEVCKPAIADVPPNDLCEQLALAEAKAGAGRVIMPQLADAPRLVALYGVGPWVKMQHTHNCSNGRKVVIHYFSNGRGLNVELKFV